MTGQGWGRAVFRCGRCSFTFAETDHARYAARVDLHGAVHRVADIIEKLGDKEPADAWELAVESVQAVLDGAHIDVLLEHLSGRQSVPGGAGGEDSAG